MSDQTPLTMSLRPLSTPAIISYGCMTLFAITVLGIFALVFLKVDVNPAMAGVLGTVLGASSTGYAAVQGFWLVNSVNPRPTVNQSPSPGGSGTP